MNQIIFCMLPSKHDELTKQHYIATGNSTIQYDGKVIFPINAVLARKLKHDVDAKVILVIDEKEEQMSKVIDLFKGELDTINNEIHANIEYVIVSILHDESIISKMAHQIEDNAELFGDFTFGDRSWPVVLSSVFTFADRFFHAKVGNIVYGKSDKDTGDYILMDMTPTHYLNRVLDLLSYQKSEDAVKALDVLLDLK